MTPERIKELRAIIAAARPIGDHKNYYVTARAADFSLCLDTIEAQQRRIEELEAALKPFASDELHEGLDDGADDKLTNWPSFRLGVFRAARAALQPKEPS